MDAIYDLRPGDTFWTASDIGWVVGHSYIVYAPLVHGCTSVLYEGKPVGTPDAGAFWRVIRDYKVRSFFTAPTAFRAVRKEDPEARLLRNYDTSSLRVLYLAGERADPDTVAWAQQGSRRAGGRSLVADGDRLADRGQSGRPRHSADQARLADRADAGLRRRLSSTRAAHPVPAGTMGSIVIRLPLPPGCLPDALPAGRPDARQLPSRSSPAITRPSDAG